MSNLTWWDLIQKLQSDYDPDVLKSQTVRVYIGNNYGVIGATLQTFSATSGRAFDQDSPYLCLDQACVLFSKQS